MNLLPLVFAAAISPQIIDVFPAQGSVGGGDLVFVRYVNDSLCDPAACSFDVLFDGVRARSVEPVDLATGLLRVITPAHPSGRADVALTVSNGFSAKVERAYRFAGRTEGPPLPENYERVLLPVVIGRTPRLGAFNSFWMTEGRVLNEGTEDVEFFYGRAVCWAGATCPDDRNPVVPAGGSTSISAPVDATQAGYFWYVQKGGAESLTFQLRIFALGAQLPVVPERQFRRRIRLDTVGVGSTGSRSALRIYSAGPAVAHVKLTGSTPQEDRSIDVPLALAGEDPDPQGFPARSYYAMVDLTTALGVTTPTLFYDIEITADRDIWAFATTTSNALNTVTIITPRNMEAFGRVRR